MRNAAEWLFLFLIMTLSPETLTKRVRRLLLFRYFFRQWFMQMS
jgi:hypothetical protein